MLEVAMATPLLLILLYLHYMFVLETLLKDGSKLSDLAWLSEPYLPCPHQAQLRTTGMDERKLTVMSSLPAPEPNQAGWSWR